MIIIPEDIRILKNWVRDIDLRTGNITYYYSYSHRNDLSTHSNPIKNTIEALIEFYETYKGKTCL